MGRVTLMKLLKSEHPPPLAMTWPADHRGNRKYILSKKSFYKWFMRKFEVRDRED